MVCIGVVVFIFFVGDVDVVGEGFVVVDDD